MRYLSTLLLIFLAFSPSYAQWKNITPNSSFQREHTNLAVVDSAVFHITRSFLQTSIPDTNTIKPRDLRTSNGGVSWTQSPYYASNPVTTFQQAEIGFDISFTDKNNGYYFSALMDLSQPVDKQWLKKITITNDGGATWTPSFINPYVNFTAQKTGFFLYYNGDFQSTSNGVLAVDSDFYYPGIGSAMIKSRLSSRIYDIKKGQALGTYYLSCKNGRIYSTQNSFLDRDSSVIIPNYSDNIDYSIRFLSTPALNTLYVATYNSSTKINSFFKSTNNGKIWTDISQGIKTFFPNGGSNRVDCGSFSDERNGILAGIGGAIITNDGGATWTKMTGLGYAEKCESKKQGNRVTAIAITKDSIFKYSYTVANFPNGIDESIVSKEIEVYPNPTIDKIIVSGEFDYIKVADILGREVKYFSNTVKTLNLNDLDNGQYFFHFYSGYGLTIKKVILAK